MPATDLFGDSLVSGTFASGSPAAVQFTNEYDDGYWTGFAYSNVDDTTDGYPNQFGAITAWGRAGA